MSNFDATLSPYLEIGLTSVRFRTAAAASFFLQACHKPEVVVVVSTACRTRLAAISMVGSREGWEKRED